MKKLNKTEQTIMSEIKYGPKFISSRKLRMRDAARSLMEKGLVEIEMNFDFDQLGEMIVTEKKNK